MMLEAAAWIGGWMPQFRFPTDPGTTELMTLRWLHFIFGIIWIGLLYFFNLVWTPAMKNVDAPARAKVYPAVMSPAMGWFRGSALGTVFLGLRYFYVILSSDAQNAGNPRLALQWLGWWFLVWIIAYGLIYGLQLPFQGKVLLRALGIAVVVVGGSWMVLVLNGGPEVSNRHLAISIGGGLGLVLLLNTWGVVWRVQKRLIRWTRASAEQGAPMPAEAQRLMRWVFITARVSLWLSLPMLFFMGAASHYPFLMTVPR